MASSRCVPTTPSRWDTPGGAGKFNPDRPNTLGATGYDYSSLATWEGDTDISLTATDANLGTPCCAVIEVYESFTASALFIFGATTSSTYYRVIRAASTARHLGNPAAGAVASQANSANTYVFQPGEANFKTEDLRVEIAADSASSATALPSGGNNAVVTGCLATASNAGAGTAQGITTGNSTSAKVQNSIAHSCEGAGFSGQGAAVYFDACTAANNGGLGFDGGTNGAVWRHCLGWNNTGGDFDSPSQSGTDYNASKDATAPGTTTWQNITPDPFKNAASDDYRLIAGAVVADLGSGLSFDDDIAFLTRPAAWSLGAHEYPWQYARADAIIAAGGWKNAAGGTLAASDLADASDATYGEPGANPTNDELVLDLTTVNTPEAGTVSILIRGRV